MGRQSIAAQVDEDAPLLAQFEQYMDDESMNSRSEALRSILRIHLNDYYDDQRPELQPEPDRGSSAGDWLEGKEAIVLGAAFAVGSNGILEALRSLAGQEVGSYLFAALGVAVLLSLLPTLYRRTKALVDKARPVRGAEEAAGEVAS